MSEGQAILVTGAARGIGRATARLAAARGWSVGVNYLRDERAAHALVEEIARGGGKAVALRGDVADEDDVSAMFDGAVRALGPLRGVVANAGIVAPAARLVDMSVERMRRMFEVNILGVYLTAREAARRLATSLGGAGGSLVLVSSTAARIGSPNLYVDYAGSKAAVDALAIGLSKELAADGVRVNSVRPGLIDTEIHAKTRRTRARFPHRRDDADGAAGHARRGRRGDRLDAQRRRLLRHRRDPRRGGGAVADRIEPFARRRTTGPVPHQAVDLLEACASEVSRPSMARFWRAASGGRRPLTAAKLRKKRLP